MNYNKLLPITINYNKLPTYAIPIVIGTAGKLLITIILFTIITSCTSEHKKTGEAIIQLSYEDDITPSYYEIIEMYKKLAVHYPEAKLLEYGKTDAGKPLHLFVISSDKDFNPVSIRKNNKRIVLINNGIHPGEPCGIDASLQFADDILRNKNGMAKYLKNTVVCIIPVYNVGGCLNRSAWHRTGQTSPKECGYRGNAKNLDLNRDFVKMDTENAKAFATIFRKWKPDVFLDTHTTNGSEHKYTITLIPVQPDYFPKVLSDFFRNKMIPALYEKMAEGDYEMIPYVSYRNRSVKKGIYLDVQTPRFSTGYVSLFNTLGFMTENHVYKNFSDRVKSANNFIRALVEFTSENGEEISKKRKLANQELIRQTEFALDYAVDTNRFDTITYRGYEAEIGISPVTGVERFGFNKNKAFEAEIPFYQYYYPTKIIIKPEMYIIPQAWSEVIDRLKINDIEMFPLSKDTILEVEVYYFVDHENSIRAYNGHHSHRNIKLHPEMQKVQFFEGDYVIPLNQESNKYIVELLEPEGHDSFFRWNFFDPCLESREYFSSYGFEGNAQKYLDKHPEFKAKFEKKKKEDKEFASNHRAQLGYIYYNTEWADERHNRYPVARIIKIDDL
jgi:hypothetical protein